MPSRMGSIYWAIKICILSAQCCTLWRVMSLMMQRTDICRSPSHVYAPRACTHAGYPLSHYVVHIRPDIDCLWGRPEREKKILSRSLRGFQLPSLPTDV